ncbi:ABC transporter ATP-binding protein/permease [Trinickia sp. LjRoot230]|uniref:ATP-binding cassette domain-containing protein n=1 Tax=Trinickia sp. LjRoot230 TaxID=3342288 RepID=UPI003ECD5C28
MAWSACGESGRIEGTIYKPAIEQCTSAKNIPLEARRYRGRDVIDLYRNVQQGTIPPGRYVYALSRSVQTGVAAKVLRWARVERSRDGGQAGELHWADPNPLMDRVPRPLSKSIIFVVTNKPIDNPASLLNAEQESSISAKAALPQRVTLDIHQPTVGETTISMRLRGRPKTQHSQELEALLTLVVLGERDEDEPSILGKLARMSTAAKPNTKRALSVTTLKMIDVDDSKTADAAAKRLQVPKQDEVRNRLFESLKVQPESATEHPIKDAKDVLKALRTLINGYCENTSKTGHAEPGAKLATFQSLLPQDLYRKYRHLQREMVAMASVSAKHPKREFIDIQRDDELARGIDEWVSQLIEWMNENTREGAAVDEDRIEALAWFYFLVRSEELNEISLKNDIDDFDDGKTRMESEVYGELARYGFSRAQLKTLLSDRELDLVQYSPRTLWRAMKVVARFGNLRQQRGVLTGVIANFILQGLVRGGSSNFYANVTRGNHFDMGAYTGYWTANYLAGDMLAANGAARVEKVMLRADIEVQRSWLNRTFYGDENGTSFEKTFNTLVRGRQAGGKLIGDALTRGSPAIMQILAAAGVLTRFDPRLAAAGLVSLPIMYLWAKRGNQKMERLYRESHEAIDATTESNSRSLRGVHDLRNLVGMERSLNQIAQQFEKERSLEHNLMYRKAWQWFWSYLPMDVGILLTVALGVELGLPAGQILASTMAFGGLTYPIQGLSRMYFDEFPRHILQVMELKEMIGSMESIDDPRGALEHARIRVSELRDFSLAFRNVSFSVLNEHGKDELIIKDVNFAVRQGEFVTIQGDSGSGKSTLIKMIGGINTPTSGEITIGNQPLDQVKQFGSDSLQDLVHYASQHAEFFPGSIFHNLILGMPFARDERELEHWRAKIQELMKRLDFNPVRFDLDREFPPNLSGGERVRMSLIRAILRDYMTDDPKKRGVLLVDEPTAGLDNRREKRVISLLTELNAGGTTLLCVTHNDELRKVGRQIDMSQFKTAA